MSEFFEKKEREGLIKRFELDRRASLQSFFDLSAYEIIIRYYLEQGKNSQALTAASQAMEHYPFSSDLLPLKAQALANLNRYDEALELLHYAQHIHPNDLEIYLVLGHTLSANNRHEEAIATYEEALGFAQEQAEELHYQIGLCHQNLHRYTEAVDCYKKSLHIRGNHSGALYELAFCLDLEGKLESSLGYYEQFIDENPYSAIAWFNLATVYEKLKQYPKALEAYQYAITIDDTFSDAYFCLGYMYAQLGDHTNALEAFQRTIALEGPGAEVYCAIGRAYENLGNYSVGIGYFRKATKIDSFYDEAWFGIGLCMTKQENWYQSLHFFSKAIKLNNQCAEYWKAAANAEYQVGNIVSSLEAYGKAITLDPDDEEVWLDWSLVHHRQGEHEKAIHILCDALKELPDSATLHYRMVVYLLEGGWSKRAICYLEKALKMDFERHTTILHFLPAAGKNKMLLNAIEKFSRQPKKP